MTEHRDKSFSPPEYFDDIRAKSQQRWEQLDADKELAGPWHQLFKQVQSPKHVVSELLQNADDAGATEACISIENSEFRFSHNGRDFSRDEFASLCRFGYSNKRSLHTIGFRGIGFKSTFSLGDEVQLRTPTLSISFFKDRFTEPVWIEDSFARTTEISVVIKDSFRQREIEKNLNSWLASPASLLFFDSLRSLHVGKQHVIWNVSKSGPVPGSYWMVSSQESDEQFLIIRSGEKQFPPDAVEEIRQERMITEEEESEFPPCKVEIVLGMKGRLFVVLPTGVETKLPFACNAPFIQDPARVKIKDPETSPTNRWLLARAGKLAATAMKAWLRRAELEPGFRSQAYHLMPHVERDDDSISGLSATIANEAFEKVIKGREILLTEQEQLVSREQCIAYPKPLLCIWSHEQVPKLFDQQTRPALSHQISSENRRKLHNRNLAGEVSKSHVLDVLTSRHLPKPNNWPQLLMLWSFVSEDVCKQQYYGINRKRVRIFPVQGRDVLYSASEVIRLGEKKLLQSDDDWQFLSTYLLVMNQNWPRFLTEQKRKADETKNDSLQSEWLAAHKILSALGLDNATDVSRVIELVAEKAFASDDYPLAACVRIAHIAAKLGATVSDKFQFVTQDGYRKSLDHVVVGDICGDLDQFVAKDWFDKHVLHDDYSKEFTSCNKSEWEQWLVTGKGQVLLFVPIEERKKNLTDRHEVEAFVNSRGSSVWSYPYKPNKFVVEDWDFDSQHWEYWESLAKSDSTFWTRLVSKILRLPKQYYAKRISANVKQIATTESRQSISTAKSPLPAWIIRLRQLPCLLDTHGQARKPTELLRRTPETEPHRDIEYFVRAEDDNEHTRHLLQLLGVGDQPPGPKKLIERLSSLSRVPDLQLGETRKWCERLDQVYHKCSTSEQWSVKRAFESRRLIPTHQLEWASTSEVFLDSADDDVPGVPLVHSSLASLSLWLKIGVKERPTVDLVIQWLKKIPTGKKLDSAELRRIRSWLPKFSERIWKECQHWLNLSGQWVAVSSLEQSLTMQSLVAYLHLFDSIKQKTADFQRLDSDTCNNAPFSDLPTLASRIEDRFNQSLFSQGEAIDKSWIVILGEGFNRICLDDPEEQVTIRQLGRRLRRTKWQIVTGLESIPYIDGNPAGTPRQTSCLWKGELLYVEDRPLAQLFKAVTQELAKVFNRNDVGDAIRACVDRPDEFVADYLNENFVLGPVESVDESKTAEELEPSSISKVDGLPTTDKIDDQTNEGLTPEQRDDLEVNRDANGEQAEDRSIDDIDDTFVPDIEPDKPRRKPQKPSRPSLIESMATAAGFSKDGERRYYHPDGGWIQRADNNMFPWEKYSLDGNLVQSYWTKESCLLREPLEIDAARWNLCEKYPEQYSIVLRAADDAPRIYAGNELVQLRAAGRLTLHPASYRAVYNEPK